ncbi:TIGR03790 family protein [Rhodoferax sp.]|uniref:TIGR03790 family protein n=1 Tax=Rhodoferax sp. TaxID=50421 RepID=UPI002ACEEF5E|nr:TIGR03790 family protein [Rhodoferax sp.]MDZ7920062.1 TIGR03790 family protein [Rhodoferax sp.]
MPSCWPRKALGALLIWLSAGVGAQVAVHNPKRLVAADMGVVINLADPYSVQVGDYYARQRGLDASLVLYVDIPVKPVLSAAEFEPLQAQLKTALGGKVRALALAWAQPYAVECNGITAAVTLGFAPEVCSNTCAPSKPSPLFNRILTQAHTEEGLRPSMLLAARSLESAKALIDRGVAADQQLGKRGVPLAHAVFVSTPDKARNVRAPLFPAAAAVPALGVQIDRVDSNQAEPLPRVVLYQTGSVREEQMARIAWVPGALADHLTSFGGQLLNSQGQMSVLDWLEAGATASYGTVSEPCNHLQKFPHPALLLAHYAQGASALEAYWRSVAWPAQGVFVGEPLAAPFGR